MISNTSMPSSTVIPVLSYADVQKAVTWLVATFGLKERLRIGEHRAQLTFGTGDIVVAQSSTATTPAMHSVMVRVADVDGHYQRARTAGARILSEPETFPYGERQYSVADIGGHVWTFSQSVADVDPRSWGGVLASSDRNSSHGPGTGDS
jgi:uncharacterized glyoxalase superfamily protein PhnB